MCMIMWLNKYQRPRDRALPAATFATFCVVFPQADPDLNELKKQQPTRCFVASHKSIRNPLQFTVKSICRAFVIRFSESCQHCHCITGSRRNWSKQKHKMLSLLEFSLKMLDFKAFECASNAVHSLCIPTQIESHWNYATNGRGAERSSLRMMQDHPPEIRSRFSADCIQSTVV